MNRPVVSLEVDFSEDEGLDEGSKQGRNRNTVGLYLLKK